MPTQYAPLTSNFLASDVGSKYHIGLSDGVNQYGYILQNWGPTDQRSAFNESSNVADKEKLVQYSSPNLIDRDLVFYPRVSQGDFSGGAIQEVFIDATKYFDSDLEVRIPGYLSLRPAWKRVQLATGVGGATVQCVAWNSDVYSTFGGTTYFNSAGTAFTPGITAKFLATDGGSLFIGDGTNTVKATIDNTTFSNVITTAGTFNMMWVSLQGTNGRFLYYAIPDAGITNQPSRSLFKVDLNNQGAGSVQVPTGSSAFMIIDLVEYQNGIAILTTDLVGIGGSDIWFHDGVNMTRIVRIEQYRGVGIAQALGDLYVTATSVGQYEPPVLVRVSSGTFEIVARPGSPLATFTAASVGSLETSGQYVFFALINPQINNVTTGPYFAVYDVLTGAYSHLPTLDALDAPQSGLPRQVTHSGRSVAFPMVSGTTGYIQYQTNTNKLAAGNQFAPSGWMVSSKVDFATPGIAKRFRRVEVHHSPLATGESVTVKGYVDTDPLAWTPTLAPKPTTATITNSTVGSDVTLLTIGNDATATGTNIGRSLIYAVQLVAGAGAATTPRIIYTAIEVGGTWVWEFDLDCTSKRRLLNQATDDPQGVKGKDLYYLLRNAYENGTTMTLFLAGGVSYAVNVENLKAQSFGYVQHQGTSIQADEEWLVHVTLRQEVN